MSTTVTYKGSTLTTANNNTKTLKTAGKYMEGDVILTDVSNDVYQDQDGYIVLPATGGGGGGDTYGWCGANTEYVGLLHSETFNLANDTSYNSWEASTTQTSILAAPTGNNYDANLEMDLEHYDYTLIFTHLTTIALKQGTVLQCIPTKIGYILSYRVWYQPSNYAEWSTGAKGSSSNRNDMYSSLVYYYDSSGTLKINSNLYGPMYARTPSMNTSSSGGKIYIRPKRGPIYACCNASTFDTSQKDNIDQTNTNMTYTIEAYRTPKTIATEVTDRMITLMNS